MTGRQKNTPHDKKGSAWHLIVLIAKFLSFYRMMDG